MSTFSGCYNLIDPASTQIPETWGNEYDLTAMLKLNPNNNRNAGTYMNSEKLNISVLNENGIKADIKKEIKTF